VPGAPNLGNTLFERQKAIPLVWGKTGNWNADIAWTSYAAAESFFEIESIEAIASIQDSVLLTYLRLSTSRLGLLINFNISVLKDGIRRFVWHYQQEDKAETLSAAEVHREVRTAERCTSLLPDIQPYGKKRQ
jgi:PD-(D/E)XK nuclease superfamily